MMEEKRKERQTVPKKPAARCEDCEFYDYDENWETYTCRVSLDEDEMARYLAHSTAACPFFEPGDEYKIVSKQN